VFAVPQGTAEPRLGITGLDTHCDSYVRILFDQFTPKALCQYSYRMFRSSVHVDGENGRRHRVTCNTENTALRLGVQRLALKVAYVSGELNTLRRCVTAGFRLEVAENGALLLLHSEWR